MSSVCGSVRAFVQGAAGGATRVSAELGELTGLGDSGVITGAGYEPAKPKVPA